MMFQKRQKQIDKMILNALSSPATVMEIHQKTGLNRSTVYSALAYRKASLMSRRLAMREGSKFLLTDEGRSEHDRLAVIFRTEREHERRSYEEGVWEHLTEHFADSKTKETLGFNVWFSPTLPTNDIRLAGSTKEAMLYAPTEIAHRLYPVMQDAQKRGDFGKAVTALAMVMIDHRRFVIATLPSRTDIAIIHSERLGGIPKNKLTETIRELLGFKPRP